MNVKGFLFAVAALAGGIWLIREGNLGQANIGEKLPSSNLVSFENTSARSLDDFAGKPILLEFFAYW